MLTTILVPFYPSRSLPEISWLTILMCTPLLWMPWEAPMVGCVTIMTDKLSSILVMLSLWTCTLMVLLKLDSKFLSLNTILLLWSLVAFFSVTSFLAFFILFEASLIPTLFLIMGWGYQPERLEASFYFIFYTVILSMPLLVSLSLMTLTSGSKYFYFDSLHEVSSGVWGTMLLCVFLIKLPIFMFHFWLPKAHVEAPVVGSMILAGVLLKTGGYGIIRVFLYMNSVFMSKAFTALGLIGMVYVCLICLYCTDLKQMIAFSSVSHMNFMIVGLMNNSQVAFSGSLIMMVSHGLCSSLMFMLADHSYKRSSSRSVLINKGFLMTIPTLTLFWGISVLFNMGVPPSINSISELLIISASSSFSFDMFMFGSYLFLSAFYSVYLYISINHGNSGSLVTGSKLKEILMSVAHLMPLSGLTMLLKVMLI